MNSKFIIGCLLLWGCTVAKAELATKVSIEQTDKINSYIMYNTGKMYFSGNNLVLDTLGYGATVSTDIATINKLTFSTVEYSETGIEKVLTTPAKVSVYPTIVENFITVQNESEAFSLFTIYSANGEVVISGKIANGEQIDATSLAKGFYFLNISGVYTKIVKL